MTSALNHAAAILFISVMLIGMGSLLVHRVRLNRLPASLVNRRKAHVAAPAEAPATVWDQTVHALGHPDTIDLDPPACPPWPTWQTITRHDRVAAAIATDH